MSNPQISPAGYAAMISQARGRSTNQELTTSLKPSHLEELLHWDEDDAKAGSTHNAALAIMAFLGQHNRTIPQWRFDRWEQLPAADFVIVQTAVAAAATTITLAPGEAQKLQEGAGLYNPTTREVMRLTRTYSDIGVATNQLTNVIRGVSGASPAIADGEKLIILGTSRPEGSADPTPNFYIDQTDYNYTQEFDKAAGITERDEHVRQWSGRNWETTQQEARRDFMVQMENSFIWGARSSSTESSYPYTTTGGIDSLIKTNRSTLAGQSLTWELFQDMIEPYFEYGSDVKFGVCASSVLTQIDRLLPSGQIRWHVAEMQGQEMQNIKYGWKVGSLETRHGLLNLVKMPRWSRYAALRTRMLILDPKHLGIVTREGGQVQLRRDREANNVTHKLICWYADQGLDGRVEGAHGWLDGWPA